MAQSTIHQVRFAGMASCVPSRVISNLEDCPPQRRSERERLVRNIGINTRRVCSEWQCFSDLAFEASEQLIHALSWDKSDIDALIVVTQSPDYLTPSTAIILQDRLKLKTTTIAFDVNLGCSGYTFGLHLLASMIASGGIKKALLLVGDKSATVNGPIFSDAGTATALEFDTNAPPMYFDLNSDGSGYQAIILPVGGHREPYDFHHHIPKKDEKGDLIFADDLVMDGLAVLNFSTKQIPPAVLRSLEYANVEKDEIDYFLFHQANRMINETIRKKLQLMPDQVPSCLYELGNCSGASVPITLTVKIREQLVGQNKKLLLCAFGIGLSWGTCILDIEQAVFPELIISNN